MDKYTFISLQPQSPFFIFKRRKPNAFFVEVPPVPIIIPSDILPPSLAGVKGAFFKLKA